MDFDRELTLSEISFDFMQSLEVFEPCGRNNPKPTFLLRGLTVTDVEVLKEKHLKVMLSDGQQEISGFIWNRSRHPALERGAAVQVVGTLELGEYQGARNISLLINHAEPVRRDDAKEKAEESHKDFLRPTWAVEWVDNPSQLEEMVKTLSRCKTLSVDTETTFDRKGNHLLCLIQIGDPVSKHTYLVDARSILDLSPLAAILSNPEITKIEHFAEFETARFAEAGIRQEGVIDTYELAGLILPYYPNRKLQTLVRYLLGKEISKLEQAGDWAARPLRDEQLFYARLDPEITYALYEQLCAAQDGAGISAALPLGTLMKEWHESCARIKALESKELAALKELEARSADLRKKIEASLALGCAAYYGPCGAAKPGGPKREIAPDLFARHFPAFLSGKASEEEIQECLKSLVLVGVKNAQGVIAEASAAGLELDAPAAKALLDSCRYVSCQSPKWEVELPEKKKTEKRETSTAPAPAPRLELPAEDLPTLMEKLQVAEMEAFRIILSHPDYAALLTKKSFLRHLIVERVKAGQIYRGEHGRAHLKGPERRPSFTRVSEELLRLGAQRGCEDEVRAALQNLRPYVDKHEVLHLLKDLGFKTEEPWRDPEIERFLEQVAQPTGETWQARISVKAN